MGADADVADRSPRCRVRHRGFRAAHRGGRRGIDGGPVDQHGAGARTKNAHNHTLEHQHLALTEIHRATGHDQLFDTLFVYENYPLDTGALFSANGLAITDITTRDYNHYPLAMVAIPGDELGLRIEYDTDVFDRASIENLTKRFKRVLVAMTADVGQQS